jgi:hypothetical protein
MRGEGGIKGVTYTYGQMRAEAMDSDAIQDYYSQNN